jgi:hypothetical protein
VKPWPSWHSTKESGKQSERNEGQPRNGEKERKKKHKRRGQEKN